MTIPEEIKKQIEDKAQDLYPYMWPKNKKGEEIVQRVGQRPPGIKKAEKIQGVFQSGASFGYSLRTPEVEALKAELERLRKENEELKERYFTADQIREIEEQAYSAGLNAVYGEGLT